MDMIQWLQGFQTEGLTAFFTAITFLGNEGFYVLILPLIFWVWDREKSVSLLYVVMLSLLVNVWMKELLQMPRPEGVALIGQDGWGFPSGHTQGTATFWIMLVLLTGRRWLGWLAGVIIVSVALSRVYLGVHYPTDILGGWFFAALMLAGYRYFGSYVREFLQEKTPYQGILHISAFLVLVTLVLPTEESLSIGGALLGFTVLYLFNAEKLRVMPGNLRMSVLAIVTGIGGMLLMKEGLKEILPDHEFFRFVRYTAVGLWIAGNSLLIIRLDCKKVEEAQ